jgi:hypothetical protein
VRLYWRWLIDRQLEFEVITGQTLRLPMRLAIEDVINTTTVLVKAGFQRLEQLAGTIGNAWPCRDGKTIMVINAVVNHMTRIAQLENEQKSIWAKIEGLLQSAETLEPRTVRPDAGGPLKAIKAAGISDWSPETKRRKLDEATFNAVVDSVTGGRKSYISAARGFLCFMKELHPILVPLPPQVEDLVLWGSFFKNAGTFATYCSAIKWITEGCGLSTEVFGHPILKRAKTALKHITVPRERRWIDAVLTQKLMKVAIQHGNVVAAMLFGAAYVFMARVPSELLKWQYQGASLTGAAGTPFDVAVQVDGVELRVHLKRRKNARHGDTIRRVCACHLAPALCPVHTFGPWLQAFAMGASPFEGWTPAKATKILRVYLAECGVGDTSKYSLHAFRRGAAQDMCDMGCTLEELLNAGGWSSRACFAYLRPQDLDMKAVIKHVVDLSDSESED